MPERSMPRILVSQLAYYEIPISFAIFTIFLA